MMKWFQAGLGWIVGGHQERRVWTCLKTSSPQEDPQKLHPHIKNTPLTRARLWRWGGHGRLIRGIAEHPDLTSTQARRLGERIYQQIRGLSCDRNDQNQQAIRLRLQALVRMSKRELYDTNKLGKQLVRLFGRPHHGLPLRAYGRVAGRTNCPHRTETLKAITDLKHIEEQRLLELVGPVYRRQPKWLPHLLEHPQAGFRVWRRVFLNSPPSAATLLNQQPRLPRKRPEIQKALAAFGKPHLLIQVTQTWSRQEKGDLLEEVIEFRPQLAGKLAGQLGPADIDPDRVQTMLEDPRTAIRTAGMRIACLQPQTPNSKQEKQPELTAPPTGR